MSAIPPNPLVSIVQTAAGAQRAAADRQAAEAAQAERSGGTFADRLNLAIHEASAEDEIAADAEGQGGHRRHQPHEPEPETNAPAEGGDPPGMPQDHIDFQA